MTTSAVSSLGRGINNALEGKIRAWIKENPVIKKQPTVEAEQQSPSELVLTLRRSLKRLKKPPQPFT